MFPSITAEMFAGSPIESEYRRLAPDPDGFPKLVEKMTTLNTTERAWPEEDIRRIAAPTLIVPGDSDIRLEHAVELFKLRGGGLSYSASRSGCSRYSRIFARNSAASAP